jgi:two-component system response regulator MprA
MAKGRVLIADDHDANREMVAYVLREDGHEVTEATDGVDAMARFASLKLLGKTPHVVITDVYMPNANGLTVAAALRAAGAQSHVLIVTAWDGEEVQRRAKTLDTIVMRKPLDLDLLRQTVARWINAGAATTLLKATARK